MNPRLHSFVFWLISRSRTAKKIILFSIDIFIGIASVWLAFYVRTDDWNISAYSYDYVIFLVIVIGTPVFYLSGLYNQIMRYLDSHLLASMLKVFAVYGVLFSTIVSVVGIANVPRSIGIIQPIIFFVLLLLEKVLLGSTVKIVLVGANQKQKIKVLIYGAGSAGRKLAEAYRNNGVYKIHGFIDDDMGLHGNSINGLKVYSFPEFSDNHLRFGIREIWLAIPSIERSVRLNIIAKLSKLGLHLRTIQGFNEILHLKPDHFGLLELDIDDLIDRPVVLPNTTLLKNAITERAVLITGAGGSIGSEIARQALALRPQKLILVDHSEFNLYKITEDLQSYKYSSSVHIASILCSIQDASRIDSIFFEHKPDIVFHAAAYKHVPLVECNILEGLKNNILGTWNCVNTALRHKVKNFVLVSTDKAVRPSSIMGASKRFSELILQAINAAGGEGGEKTIFSMVRFGNVLNSSGSVIPLFKRQIERGGPITLTDKGITRYFMTIPEAAQLVIQSASIARGGDVFILDMGEPISIYDLAIKMVHLSGLTIKSESQPDGNIEVEIIGLRPGEKLHEELFMTKSSEITCHPKIIKAHERFIPIYAVEDLISEMRVCIDQNDEVRAKAVLWSAVDNL